MGLPWLDFNPLAKTDGVKVFALHAEGPGTILFKGTICEAISGFPHCILGSKLDTLID